ncbi:MAG: N-acetyltransferase [Spirochaetota bacterium]|nr:N-acetyltransferase [Spirochaetota bacterium]
MIIRKAKVTEAKNIKLLIDQYAKKSLMLERGLDEIYEKIRDFTVCSVNEKLVGVCALVIFNEDFAEIRSLAVSDNYKGKNIGEHLIKSCITEALEYNIHNIFTLTYIPDYFKKLNFQPVDKDSLPHKIWRDCIKCEHFYNCDEESLIYKLDSI